MPPVQFDFFPGQSFGLNNRVRPDSLPRTRKGAAMRELLNFVHDDDGAIRTRHGSLTVLNDAAYAPLMPLSGNRFYAVRHFDGEKKTEIVVCTASPGVLQAAKIKDCASYGEEWGWHFFDGCCWASSRSERFVLKDGMAAPWPEYHELQDDGQYSMMPLPFSPITERWGPFVVSAVGNVLYRSEPGRETVCRKATAAIPIEDEITLLATVDSGLYVGGRKGVWFLLLQDFGLPAAEYNFAIRRVAAVGALPGSRCVSSKHLLTGYDVGIESHGLGVAFQLATGPVWGGPDGTLIKIENNLQYPESCGTAGSTMWIKGRLIHSRW